MRIGDEVCEYEGTKVGPSTAKAILVELTNDGKEYWIPRSQLVSEIKNGDDTWIFQVTEWWAKKNNLNMNRVEPRQADTDEQFGSFNSRSLDDDIPF